MGEVVQSPFIYPPDKQKISKTSMNLNRTTLKQEDSFERFTLAANPKYGFKGRKFDIWAIVWCQFLARIGQRSIVSNSKVQERKNIQKRVIMSFEIQWLRRLRAVWTGSLMRSLVLKMYTGITKYRNAIPFSFAEDTERAIFFCFRGGVNFVRLFVVLRL